MSQRVSILVATILGSAIVFLDGTIVNVALEAIGDELPTTFVARLEGLTYVNSAYFTVLSALLILAGALNDYYGRRRMFQIGLAGFGLASVACGLAPTMEVLIGARVVHSPRSVLLNSRSGSGNHGMFPLSKRQQAISEIRSPYAVNITFTLRSWKPTGMGGFMKYGKLAESARNTPGKSDCSFGSYQTDPDCFTRRQNLQKIS